MPRTFFLLLSATALAVCLGCEDGPADKVKGVWKVEGGAHASLPTFLEITEKQIIENGNADGAVDIAIDEKDGRAVLRRAGTDDIVLIVSFADDKTAAAESPLFGGRQKLLPSSREEMQGVLFPSPEKIFGFWRYSVFSGAGEIFEVVEIGKDFVRHDDIAEKVEITSRMGAYHFEGSDIFQRSARLKDDTLVSGRVVYLRTSKEDAEKFIAEKRAFPDKIVGLWLAEDPDQGSRGDKAKYYAPEFLDITRTALVKTSGANEKRQEGRLTFSNGLFTMLDGDGVPVLSVGMVDEDHIRESGGTGFSRPPTYRRVTQEEKDSILKAYASASDDVLGIWRKKTARDAVGSNPFLEITRERLSVAGKDLPIRAISARSGTVNIAVEGVEREYRVTVGDKSITLDSPDKREYGEYVPSSAAERDEYLNAQNALPDKIVGFWRTTSANKDTKYFTPMSITRDSLAFGGNTYSVVVKPVDENRFEIVDAETGGKYATVSLQPNGCLRFDTGNSDTTGYYDRATPDEYGKLVKGEPVLPAAFAGYWITEEQKGVAVQYGTLFLRDGEIVRNGYAEPLRVSVTGYNILFMNPLYPNYQIASLDFNFERRDQMRLSFREGSIRYKKATQDEYEKALGTCRVDVDSLFGAWLSEPIKRNKVPRAAINIVKGEKGQWPVVLQCMGLSIKDNKPENNLLAGIVDLKPNGDIILRGGDDLKAKIAEVKILGRDDIELVEHKYLRRKLTYRRSDMEAIREAFAGE